MDNPNPRPNHPDGPELDLYTIPRHSSWFRWDDIHETERTALKEFFHGSSITRTPKIYKEYRDFIINKYREDPSRRLTFTEIRKSLVGDVSLLQKVFHFLDKWGLINFGAPPELRRRDDLEIEETGKVRVEDSAPNGVRVVATPNSLKPISVLPRSSSNKEVGESEHKLPPLASFSDVFGELEKHNKFVCGSCRESCNSTRYEYTKGDYALCVKCFENGRFGDNKSKDDFKLNESVEGSGKQAVWTDEEMLLLLESVMRHGDEWDLVAQNVQTKSKLECISKLIELPFGDLILGSAYQRGNFSGLSGSTDSSIQVPLSSSNPQEIIQRKEEDLNEQNGEDVEEGPPSKRKRIASLTDAGSSLMKQVALISTMVDSDITAAAADAAVAALCDETSFPRQIFDDDDFLINGLQSTALDSGPESSHQNEDSEMKDRTTQSEIEETQPMQNDIPLTLRLRASIGTALGSAAAHAKLLADQEDREIESLVAAILETQLKKLHRKIKHFDELELIMEKQHTELEELKESLTEERIDALQKAINAGISRWRDRDSVKS